MPSSFIEQIAPISARHYSRLYEQLGRGLKAGLPAENIVTTMQRGRWPSSLKKLLKDLGDDIRQGQSIVDSLARHPNLTSPFERHWLAAAETAGRLPKALDSLAARHQKKHGQNLQLLGSLVYPSCLLTAASLLGPLHIAFAGDLSRYFKLALTPVGLLFALILFAYWMASAPAGQTWRIRCLRIGLRLPFFGPILKGLGTAQLSLLLAECLNAGITASNTFALASEAAFNPDLASACKEIERDLKRGESLSTAMHRHPDCFPEELLSVIDTGEASGRLDEALAQANTVWQEDADRSASGVIRFVAGGFTITALGTVGMLILHLGVGILQRLNSIFQL